MRIKALPLKALAEGSFVPSPPANRITSGTGPSAKSRYCRLLRGTGSKENSSAKTSLRLRVCCGRNHPARYSFPGRGVRGEDCPLPAPKVYMPEVSGLDAGLAPEVLR